MISAPLASSAHLRSADREWQINPKGLPTVQLWCAAGRRRRHTWTWEGALRTNVTALATSSAFKHLIGDKSNYCDSARQHKTYLLQKRRIVVLWCSHTPLLLSLDHCCGAGRQIQSLQFREIYTAGVARCETITGQCSGDFSFFYEGDPRPYTCSAHRQMLNVLLNLCAITAEVYSL